jgi:hypothetical protein
MSSWWILNCCELKIRIQNKQATAERARYIGALTSRALKPILPHAHNYSLLHTLTLTLIQHAHTKVIAEVDLVDSQLIGVRNG